MSVMRQGRERKRRLVKKPQEVMGGNPSLYSSLRARSLLFSSSYPPPRFCACTLASIALLLVPFLKPALLVGADTCVLATPCCAEGAAGRKPEHSLSLSVELSSCLLGMLERNRYGMVCLCPFSSAQAFRGGCGNQGTGGCETIHPNSHTPPFCWERWLPKALSCSWKGSLGNNPSMEGELPAQGARLCQGSPQLLSLLRKRREDAKMQARETQKQKKRSGKTRKPKKFTQEQKESRKKTHVG